MEQSQRVCTKCNAKEGVRIVCGMASYELGEMAREGTVVLGGCLVSPENSKWHCKSCGNEWGKEQS